MPSVSMATPASYVTPSEPVATPAVAAADQPDAKRLTMIALKSGEVQGVRSYRVDKGIMNYVLPNGMGGSVYVTEVDWRATTQLNSDKNIVVPSVVGPTDSFSAVN
jgi:hypothetical protein